MAKKSRTPDPPRRVQAPKRRQPERRGLDPARRRSTLLYGGASAGVVAVVIVLVVVLGGRGGGGKAADPAKIAATMRAAGCQYKDVAAESGLHIGHGSSERLTYNTYPPTSGRHDEQSVIWGNYRQPVDPRQAVHNMEHGGIVIWYGPKISEAVRQQIGDFYDESPNGILVTPIEPNSKLAKYPQHTDVTTQIALTAWTATVSGSQISAARGVVAICPRFSEQAFAAFRDTFRGKGPERFPVDQLRPGTA